MGKQVGGQAGRWVSVSSSAEKARCKLQRSNGTKSVEAANPIKISIAKPIQSDVGSPGFWRWQMAVSGPARKAHYKLQRSGGRQSAEAASPIEISMALPIQLDISSPSSIRRKINIVARI